MGVLFDHSDRRLANMRKREGSYQSLPQRVHNQIHLRRGPGSVSSISITPSESSSGRGHSSIYCPGLIRIPQQDEDAEQVTGPMKYENIVRESTETKRKINLNSHRQSYLDKGPLFMFAFFLKTVVLFLKIKDNLLAFCSLLLKSYQFITLTYVFFYALYPLYQLYQKDEATLQDCVIASGIVTVQWMFLSMDFMLSRKFKAFFAKAMIFILVIICITVGEKDGNHLSIMKHFLFFFTAEVCYHIIFEDENISIMGESKICEPPLDKMTQRTEKLYENFHWNDKQPKSICTYIMGLLMLPLMYLIYWCVIKPEEEQHIEIAREDK